MFINYAYAQAAGAAVSKPGFLEQMFPLIFMFVVLYFILIRPQSKKESQRKDFLSKVKRGDSVLTSGGILGTVNGMTDKFVTLEVSEGVNIKVLKNQLVGLLAGEAK
ncbi:MAG: preprotein translocase subunit YajC [Pseudomonadota bacterium]|nr:preprotein translocase subunit YajC [Pseudomonadota bacterium]